MGPLLGWFLSYIQNVNNGKGEQWWKYNNDDKYNEMECVRNVEVDIFHLRHWSNSECVEEEMMFTDGMEGHMESY